MSSVILDRSHSFRGNQNASEVSQGSGQGRQLTHDPLDGKTHILYVMFDGHGKIDPNCSDAYTYAKRIQSVVVQDAMTLVQRPTWLQSVPTLACIAEKRGNTGQESVQELMALLANQEKIQTIGIARPIERDASGFPAFAQMGGSMTNSAMLNVGSVEGMTSQDPNRYSDGKLSSAMATDAIALLMQRREQKLPFTNRQF